jgi:hypothetical protein
MRSDNFIKQSHSWEVIFPPLVKKLSDGTHRFITVFTRVHCHSVKKNKLVSFEDFVSLREVIQMLEFKQPSFVLELALKMWSKLKYVQCYFMWHSFHNSIKYSNEIT